MTETPHLPQRAWHHLLLGSALALFHMLYYLGWSLDDPSITFHYVKHVAAGEGFVFNVGAEPVEGFSNLLWLLLLLPVQWLMGPAHLMGAAQLLGMACALATGPLLAHLWQRTGLPAKDAAPLWRWLPLYAWALSGPAMLWAVGGLETASVALLITLVLAAVRADWHRRPGRAAAVGLLFVLLALSRPEGPMWGIVFYAALLCRLRGNAKAWFLGAFPFAAGLLALEAWRLAIFGDWLPNTYYAKMGSPLIWRLRGGAAYLGDSLAMTGGLPLLAWVGLFAWRRSPAIRVAALFAALQLLFILLTGGDWMPGGRFLVPAIPCLILLLTAGFRRGWDGLSALTRRRAVRDLLILLLLIWFGASMIGERFATRDLVVLLRTPRPPSEALGPGHTELLGPLYEAANWILLNTDGDDTLAGEEAGLVPFVTDRPFLDLTALNDRHLARLPGPMHGKMDVDYVVNEWAPDWVLLITLSDDGSGEVRFAWGDEAAGATLGRSEAFQERYEEAHQIPRMHGEQVVRIYERVESEDSGPTQ